MADDKYKREEILLLLPKRIIVTGENFRRKIITVRLSKSIKINRSFRDDVNCNQELDRKE